MIRAFTLIAFALSVCGCAPAQPIQLACTGKMQVLPIPVDIPKSEWEWDYIFALTIDLRARTVAVGSYGTVPIIGDTGGDTLAFQARDVSRGGVSTALLNRISGVTDITVIRFGGGLYMFHGICKPAQKLF
jgi:hypothetical protein